jgi:hypothetical protein
MATRSEVKQHLNEFRGMTRKRKLFHMRVDHDFQIRNDPDAWTDEELHRLHRKAWGGHGSIAALRS